MDCWIGEVELPPQMGRENHGKRHNLSGNLTPTPPAKSKRFSFAPPELVKILRSFPIARAMGYSRALLRS